MRLRFVVVQIAAAPGSEAHKISYPNDEEIRVTTVEKSNIGGADKTKEVRCCLYVDCILYFIF